MWLLQSYNILLGQSEEYLLEDSPYRTNDMVLFCPPNMIKKMLKFAYSFNKFDLTETEIALVSAVALANPDRSGLGNCLPIAEMQSTFLEALQIELSRSHGLGRGRKLFAEILLKMTDLTVLSELHAQNARSLKVDSPGVEVPQLYAEIYDIPQTPAVTSEDEFVINPKYQQLPVRMNFC